MRPAGLPYCRPPEKGPEKPGARLRKDGSPSVKGSLQIGTAFGIPIRIHWTFLLMAYVMLLLALEPLKGLLFFALAFGCVLLHELGHSLVAKSFGIRVLDITFWPLGGLARMSEIPESPRIEGLISIAGPAVNFALMGLGIALALVMGVLGWPGREFVLVFAAVNLFQGAFNLLPAFPMDGGRLLRSFLARKRDWLSATEVAVRVGRVIATLLFVGSLAAMLYWREWICVLPLVAGFVWVAGARELVGVRLRHGANPFGGAAGGPWRPAESSAAPTSGASEPPSDPQDPQGARRPTSFEAPPLAGAGPQGGAGFSEETLRRLERFPGRLRPPPEEPH